MVATKNYFLQTHPDPIIIAHRGASGEAPENTMASFKLALRQKADAIEFDVQRTRDGRLVLLHDPVLGRTNDGKGRIGSKSLRSLDSIDAGSWFDPRFKNERIPSLGHILDTFGTKTHYVIELKFYQRDKTGFARQVYEMVAQRGLLERTMFLSFSATILDAIKARDSNAVTCLAIVPHAPLSRKRALARHDIAATSITSRWVHRVLSRRNQPINCWVGREHSLRHHKHRVDMITTDWPGDTRRSLQK